MFVPQLSRRLAMFGIELNCADRTNHMTPTFCQVDAFCTTTRINRVLFVLGDDDGVIDALVDADAARNAIGEDAICHDSNFAFY